MHKAEQENCIIHPRASSVKQAEGETLEDQEKLGRILASSNNWKVVAVFGWIHSGRKTEREDMEEVIAYIKKSEVKISHYITKGIDRFTRLGGTEYMRFKSELEKLGMQVWDTEGIIQQKGTTWLIWLMTFTTGHTIHQVKVQKWHERKTQKMTEEE